ncbi:MAG: hypothetical protein WC794_04605 [Candidatus Doudnabacteria bacterium]|jgi:hypothetical protein
MQKIKFQAEIERIRKLSPAEFVRQQTNGEDQTLEVTKEEAERIYNRWAFYLAASTDLQIYELLKTEFGANVKEFGDEFFEEYAVTMLEKRAEFRESLGIKIPSSGGHLELGAKEWEKKIEELKKLHKMHKELKDNPEIMKNMFKGRDFTPRA